MKEAIDPFEYSTHILQSVSSGTLLTTSDGYRVNTMVIGWGMLGTDWRMPIFIPFVRSSRLTYEYLLANPQFTLNVPVGPVDRHIIGIAGTKSGRYIDKIKELDLHLEKPEKISVPGIREFPLTLECEVIYRQEQDKAAIPAKLRETFYPESGIDMSKGLNRASHTAFYGAIVAAYLIK